MYTDNAAESTLGEQLLASTKKPSRKKSRREVLRLKLQKLTRLRFGNHFLPDDDDGRAMLTALLCVGLTGESATESAPWCNASELRKLRSQAKQVKWWRDKAAIGKLINLTFEEWKSAKLWLTWPINASDDDIEAWREEQRKISSRKSSAKQRTKEKMQKQTMLEIGRTLATTPRQKAIIDIIIRHHAAERGIKCGMSVPKLIKKVEKLPEFERVKNLRDAVHETISQLERKRAVSTRFYNGHRVKCVEWPHGSTKAIPRLKLCRRAVGLQSDTVLSEMLAKSITYPKMTCVSMIEG